MVMVAVQPVDIAAENTVHYHRIDKHNVKLGAITTLHKINPLYNGGYFEISTLAVRPLAAYDEG
jgi:hypothetical protein